MSFILDKIVFFILYQSIKLYLKNYSCLKMYLMWNRSIAKDNPRIVTSPFPYYVLLIFFCLFSLPIRCLFLALSFFCAAFCWSILSINFYSLTPYKIYSSHMKYTIYICIEIQQIFYVLSSILLLLPMNCLYSHG